MSAQWFTVRADNGKVVLDIFPNEPGGATLHLAAEVAIQLIWQLKRAVAEVKEGEG